MALIKMKYLLLLTLFACSCMVLQIFSWKIVNPTLPINFGFSRRLQGPLFGDKSANGQSETYLALEKGSQQPHVKQRTIRDLMNRFMANNRRIPMASAPSYNRPGVQNGPVNPSVPQNFRGPSSHTRYRQALPLPSSPVSHSLENPRPQPMIRQGPSLRKPNAPSSLRPESMLHNSPRRPPAPRNISPLRKEVKASLPSRMQPPRQHNTASLGSAMTDILSSSSTSQIRNQNTPKRVVEVVHHLPLSRLNTHSPAVVYISKPKTNIPSPQSMYMRDIPETQMLPPSQAKLPQNSPFIMNGQDSIIPKRNNLKQDIIPLKNNFQNTGITAPKSKPIHHQMQTSHLVPPTGLQGKYIKDNTEDHRNLQLTSVLNKSPPAQALGGMRPSAHMKQESSQSFVRPISTQNNTPRLNRLRQELNAEIQELLKLVSPDPALGTKRPRIVPQRQVPHPYLAPSSQYEDTLGTSNPENINAQHNRKIPVQKSNPFVRQRLPPPHFSRPENIKEQALKIQAASRLPFPPVSDGLDLNQRRPVVSESSVDSEELSQILKSVGYEDDSKFIRNAAGVRPVKLIIPGEDGKRESHTSSESVFNSPSYNSKDLEESQNFNSFSSQNENLKLSHDENSSSHLAEESPVSQNENIMPSHNQYFPSSNDNDLPPAENTYVSITDDDEDVSSYQKEFSPPVDSTASPPLDTKDQNLSNSKDSLYLENEEDSESSEAEFFPSHQNGDDSEPPDNPESLSLQNKENLQLSGKNEVQHLPNNESSPSEAENSTYSKTVVHSLHTVNLSSDSNIQPSNDTSTNANERHLANESLPSNKSSLVKTYWDFRKLNGHLQAETSSPKIVKIEKQPPFSHSVNNYQGEESIASVSVKEELSDEELKEKNNDKNHKDKPNSETLYDIYNKKILDEKKQDVPASHSVRYLPQHYVPEEPEIESVPNFENNNKSPELIHPVDSLNTNPGDAKIIYKEASNFLKPKEKIRNGFPALNIRPVVIRTTTVIPKYLTTNRNFNVNPFQRTTPRYFVTKTPARQHFGLRNRPLNADNLNQRYLIPGRQQFNNNAFLQNLNPPVDHRVPEMHVQHYTNPRVTKYWLKPSTTESTIQSPSILHSSELKKYNLGTRAQNQFNVFGMSKSTTETPLEVIHSSEVTTAESQIKNTQKAENKEFSQASETIRSTNKQFFRGPQHSITFEYSTTESYEKPTVNLVPSSNSFETTASSVVSETTEDPEIKESIPYNETGGVRQYSVHTQTKVINALHLANKVFGRRNHTSHKQTTTKVPTHKFSYSPVTKPTIELSLNQSESNDSSKKVVFNFRTGTTQSLPLRPSSVAPKIINNSENSGKLLYKVGNDSLEFVPSLKEKDKIIISPKNSSKASLFHHIVFSQPNISSKSTVIESSTVTETNKDLYGILKPITKPYNSSMTSVEEKEVKKLTTKAFRIRINSTTIKTTTPLSTTEFVTTQQVTHPPSRSVPVVSEVSVHIKKQRILPTTTKSLTKTTKENVPEETTAPYTSTSVAQTVAPTKDNLVANITMSSTEVMTEPIDQEQLIVDSLKSMKLKMQEMASKGLRHIMPLVMELSSDVSISSDCTFSLLRWLRAVRTMEQWAVRMMDASSKIPEGILYGTFSTFGSYDECIGIKTPKANLQMPYNGQYCSINIQPILPPKSRHFTTQNAFRRYPKLKQVFQEMNIDEDTMAYYYILKHRIGLCMPSTCSIEDLGNVTEKMADQLNMKISVERCETSEKPKLTKGQVISLSSVLVAFAIVILATAVDITIRFKSKHEMDIDEVIRKKNALRQFSYVFSAYGNARKILDTSIPTTHLSSLHGIKFLSISWVMLGHVYYCKDYLTLAGLNKVRDLGSNLAFQVVLNSAFAADTFFFLSGLLVVYSTFLYLENNNGHFTIVGFYIRRYWRLTPAFLMISGVILLGPLAGSGPIWHETLHPFVSGCENYWWTNLFYFSNFVPTDKTCVPHGWFLSCDMQFYIVAPIIILALYRRPKLGILLIILGILSSMITTGFLTFLYDLPPVSLFSLPDPKDINEYLDTVGYKPYTHYASYCVGMATGFLLAAKQKISLSRYLQTFGWIISTIGCCLVIYGTWNWNSGELPSWPVSVAYASTSRTVWCVGVAWLTVVCYAGHGGPVNSILSWHGFIPLSRLSYLAYLIHPLLMYLYASYVRSPFYFSQYVVVYLYLGHVCVTFGLAFLFSLAFEVPFLNLEKLIIKYLDRSRRKRRASFSSHHHNNWQHPEHPEMKDSVVLMRRRPDKFLT